MLSEGQRHLVVMMDNTFVIGMITADHSERIQLLIDNGQLMTIPWTAIKRVVDEGGVFEDDEDDDDDDGGGGDYFPSSPDDDPPYGAKETPRRWTFDV